MFAPLDPRNRSTSELHRQKSSESTIKPVRPDPEISEAKLSSDIDAEHKDDTKTITKMKSSRFSSGDAIYSSYEDLKEEEEADEEADRENSNTFCCSISKECRICGVKVRFHIFHILTCL